MQLLVLGVVHMVCVGADIVAERQQGNSRLVKLPPSVTTKL